MFDGRCLIGTGVRLRTFGISSDKKRLYSCHFMLQVATAPEAAGVAAKPVAQDWTTEVNDSLHWSMCRRWNWLHNILFWVVRNFSCFVFIYRVLLSFSSRCHKRCNSLKVYLFRRCAIGTDPPTVREHVPINDNIHRII